MIVSRRKLRPKKRKGPARREPNERPYCLIVGWNTPSCNYGLGDFYRLRPAVPANARPPQITVNVALDARRPKLSGHGRPPHPIGAPTALSRTRSRLSEADLDPVGPETSALSEPGRKISPAGSPLPNIGPL